MTNDEILAALENARMDVHRAFRTVNSLPSPYDEITLLVDAFNILNRRISMLKGATNERG